MSEHFWEAPTGRIAIHCQEGTAWMTRDNFATWNRSRRERLTDWITQRDPARRGPRIDAQGPQPEWVNPL